MYSDPLGGIFEHYVEQKRLKTGEGFEGMLVCRNFSTYEIIDTLSNYGLGPSTDSRGLIKYY